MSHNNALHHAPLSETATAAHDRARTALTGPASRTMDAVVWLSAHLTAMEHVVYPFMRTTLPTSGTEIDEQRRLTRRMQGALRPLEQRSSGDGLAPPGSSDRLRSQLTVMIAEHEQGEEALLTRLLDTLSDEAALTLAERYDHAIGHGPIRPHPHGPHRGKLGRLTYALDAARDHILDVLDSRHVPLPRTARPHRQVGRWGRYLLGFGESVHEVASARPESGQPIPPDPPPATRS
jgi:hypothetical protein